MPIDPLVQNVLNRTEAGRHHHDTLVRTYDRAYQTYRARRQPNTTKPAWEADLRVPYAQQIVDTVLVNIISGKPRFRVRPRHPQDVKAATAMQIALDYFVDRDHLAEKQVPFTQQALIYGATLAKNQWAYREAIRRSNQFVNDPFSQEPVRLEKAEKVLVQNGPTFEPWDIYDAWWEPNARDVDTAAYMVLRSWLTADELKAHAKREDNPFGLFENVDELLKSGARNVPTVTAQESYVGATERRKDRFEVWEVWTDDSLIVIGNRQVLLRHVPNPFWHNQKPIVFASVRPDLFQMQGIPEVDLVADIQEAMWSIQNARLDNLNLTVHAGITVRESGVGDANSLIQKPRFKWLVQDHDDVKAFQMPQIDPQAWQEDAKLLSQMQLVSGVNPYVSGSDLNTVDQNTATGVTALQEVASRLLRFKARQLAYCGFQRTGEQWAALVKQFLTEPLLVRIEGADNEYDWHEVDPQSIVGDFDTAVEGTEESLSRQQQRGEAMGLLNALAPFGQLGIVNWPVILEKVGEAFDFPNPKMLIQPAPPPQQPAAPVAPNGNGNGASGTQQQMGQQQQQIPGLPPELLQAAGQAGGLTLNGS